MSEERGHWYLVTGLIIGAALGVAYAWFISPVQYVDTSPASLREDFKEQYRALVASAYMLSSDLVRAKARLDQLKDPDINQTIAMQAQRSLAEERPEAERHALGMLAMALSQEALPEATVLNQGSSSSKVGAGPNGLSLTDSPDLSTPGSSITAIPTPSSTPEALYTLQDIHLICDQGQNQPMIQVQVENASLEPVPGVEVFVNWPGGEENFFTGLKPELGLGFADFAMIPSITYTIRLEQSVQQVPGLAAKECELAEVERYWGFWRLVFVQK